MSEQLRGHRDLWVYLLVALGGAWLVALPLWLAGGLGSGFGGWPASCGAGAAGCCPG
ncbi:hypothetical protein ACWDKQ_18065 [Saccharopolyspora sp. NPDC000995]